MASSSNTPLEVVYRRADGTKLWVQTIGPIEQSVARVDARMRGMHPAEYALALARRMLRIFGIPGEVLREYFSFWAVNRRPRPLRFVRSLGGLPWGFKHGGLQGTSNQWEGAHPGPPPHLWVRNESRMTEPAVMPERRQLADYSDQARFNTRVYAAFSEGSEYRLAYPPRTVDRSTKPWMY